MKFTFLLALILTAACTTTQKSPQPTRTEVRDESVAPSLTKPKIRSYLVPDTIEGNKYIKAHRVFVLEDAGSWIKD